MRDPRNWVRPVVAAGVTATAGTALVVLRVRARQHARRGESSTPDGVRRAHAPRHRRGSSPGPAGPVGTSQSAGLLPPSHARDRRLVLQLRASDLPGLHDADLGRDALPGVRGRAHEGATAARPGCDRDVRASHLAVRPADLVGHADADRDQRDRVPVGGRRRPRARRRSASLVYAYIHGVLLGPAMSHGYHQYWRLLTSGFLHASIIHIGFNMLSLWFVGRSLEPAIGRALLRRDLLHRAAGRLVRRAPVHAGRADARRLRRDLRGLRRADHGRPRPRASRSGSRDCCRSCSSTSSTRSRRQRLGRRPPRRVPVGLRHGLAGDRVRREARQARGRAHGLPGDCRGRVSSVPSPSPVAMVCCRTAQ